MGRPIDVIHLLALAALPGALAGVHLNGLLFFLNPHLPFGTWPWLRGALLYSSMLAGLSTVLLTLVTRGRLGRMQRLLPWFLFLVFTAAAIYDSVHASWFAYYLPPGINRRLIKAAIWLSLGAVIVFYTALLHSLNRRPYGRRSRTGLLLLALLSVFVVVERREAYRPPPEAAPRPSTVASHAQPHLVVVGLEGATLDAVLPLAQQGQLPFLATTLEQGAYARLRSLTPTRRGPLWMSVATGKHPYQHGIVDEEVWRAEFLVAGGEFRLLPMGMGFESWGVGPRLLPAERQRRQTLTLWEIFSRLGLETAVVGWPASEPLSPGNLAGWSDRYFQESPSRDDSVADLARVWSEFEPGTPEVLRAPLVEDTRRLRRAFEVLPSEQDSPLVTPDALFLVLPGLREVSARFFGGYAAAQLEGSQAAQAQEARRLLVTYYKYLDAQLARLWESMPPPRLMVVVSAHGTDPPSLVTTAWRRLSGQGDVGGAFAGGPDGLLLLRGASIQGGTFLPRVDLVDVAPTLLYSLGFPLARDLPGELLTDAFSASFLAETPITYVPSYETLSAGPSPQSARLRQQVEEPAAGGPVPE